MKKLSQVLLATILLLNVVAAYAACSTHSISSGGRLVTCTTCCDNYGNCNTTCF